MPNEDLDSRPGSSTSFCRSPAFVEPSMGSDHFSKPEGSRGRWCTYARRQSSAPLRRLVRARVRSVAAATLDYAGGDGQAGRELIIDSWAADEGGAPTGTASSGGRHRSQSQLLHRLRRGPRGRRSGKRPFRPHAFRPSMGFSGACAPEKPRSSVTTRSASPVAASWRAPCVAAGARRRS